MKLSELKELAEKAIADQTLHVTKEFVDNFPSTVLALLADREQLRFLLKAFFYSVCENGGGYVVSKDILDKAQAALEKSDELEG